jgi:hypothetical protein
MNRIKIIFTISMLICMNSLFAQAKKDTLLVFNHRFPIMHEGIAVYYLEDLLAADTVMTNIRGLRITVFSLTTNCIGSDLVYTSFNGVMTTDMKAYLKDCIKGFPHKVWFGDITMIDGNGQVLRFQEKVITLYKKPK